MHVHKCPLRSGRHQCSTRRCTSGVETAQCRGPGGLAKGSAHVLALNWAAALCHALAGSRGGRWSRAAPFLCGESEGAVGLLEGLLL